MVQRGQQLPLPGETLTQRLAHERAGGNFDRHQLLEHIVSPRAEVHGAHAPSTNLAQYPGLPHRAPDADAPVALTRQRLMKCRRRAGLRDQRVFKEPPRADVRTEQAHHLGNHGRIALCPLLDPGTPLRLGHVERPVHQVGHLPPAFGAHASA